MLNDVQTPFLRTPLVPLKQATAWAATFGQRSTACTTSPSPPSSRCPRLRCPRTASTFASTPQTSSLIAAPGRGGRTTGTRRRTGTGSPQISPSPFAAWRAGSSSRPRTSGTRKGTNSVSTNGVPICQNSLLLQRPPICPQPRHIPLGRWPLESMCELTPDSPVVLRGNHLSNTTCLTPLV